MRLPSPLLASAARHPLRRHFPALCLAIGLASASSLAPAADAPLWFAEEGPTLAARQAVDLLVNAAADGLDRRDYNADWLRDAIAAASRDSPLTENQKSALDGALTSAMRRYLTDLHSGRVEPDRLGANYRPAASAGFDPDSLLYSAITNNGLADVGRSAAPPLPQYASLRQALANYRQLAGNPTWKRDLPPLPAGRLSSGQKYDGIPDLLQRLRLLGDLPTNSATPPRYEGQVVDGIKSFQARHGLAPNGVLETDTLEQLNVTPATRVRQLELALERLRWTPLLPAPRVIVVNIPEFMLHAYEVHDGTIDTRVAMKVIVGTAGKHRTPLFNAEMQFIEFSPYWNVPPSIARSETLPRLRRDPGYFQRQGFEFVGSDGRVVGGFSESSLEAVQRGQMRIRQRPGAGNALGDIKFVFPNADNIYLHHTSTPRLFKRDRRDFSHGCIRVEAPVELAKFVLAGEPEWTEQRIIQTMRKGKSVTIRLYEGLPVVIAYTTAAVRDGRVHFFPDLYGHDRLLDDALRQRSQRLRASQTSQFAAKSQP